MVATLVTETAGKTTHLPIPPAAFAILALAGFGLLLLITFAFQNVWHRH